jgi:hypothetical protein
MIGAGYAVVSAYGAWELYERHVWEAAHPAEVSAASGMYAGGDMILDLWIVFLLMIPTIFLVRVISRFEAPAAVYSKILFLISLSAPLCFGISLLGEKHVPANLIVSCLVRLLWSPLFLVLMFFSRIVSKFQNARRLTTYALLSEGVTICVAFALLIFRGRH